MVVSTLQLPRLKGTFRTELGKRPERRTLRLHSTGDSQQHVRQGSSYRQSPCWYNVSPGQVVQSILKTNCLKPNLFLSLAG